MSKYVRTKRAPAKDTLCECTVGVDPDSRQPHLIRCKNAASATLRGPPFGWEQFVCETCANKILSAPDSAGKEKA